ncbi:MULTISPECIES: ankyrin repeat domain-containing protein [Spirulina sp. CCY15215]|uniref:ankyrin repeat domain-containing protein n=1 Tax=Spirulina sp. CCY15215 TaxID=2767591 RepID=UPI00195088F5|nr:ankyrin repeat domain-containing protein [Spirulina major]
MKSFFDIKSQKFDEFYEQNQKSLNKISWNEIDSKAAMETFSELFDLDSEFNPNEINEDNTILLEAITTGRLEWVEFLVRKGADVNFGHKEGGYPLEIAAGMALKEIYDYLEPLTDIEIKHFIFISFTVNHEHKPLQTLIDSSIDVDSPRENGNGRTPLIIAVQQGDEKMVKMLLQAGANPNLKDDVSGTTPLISAVKGQYLYLTRLLLDNRADVNISDINGDTAFEIALNLRNEKQLSYKKKLRNEKIIDLLIKKKIPNL